MPPTPTPPDLQPITPANAKNLRLIQTLQIPGFSPGKLSQCSVAFSPDGRLLTGVCYNNTAPVWEAATGKLLFELLEEAEQLVAVSFSPDSRYVATGGYDGQARLYDAHTGKQVRQLSGLSMGAWELDFSPSGERLAAASLSSGIQTWKTATGEARWNYGGKRRLRALSVAYAPDGRSIACGLLSGGVVVLDAQSGAEKKTLQVAQHVGDVTFSRDSSLLASGSDDNLIRIWRAADFKLLHTLEGHGDFVNGVAFSPDGAWIVSGSHDKTLGVWDVQNGLRLATLDGHEDTVLRVAVNPSGTLIASISWDGTVRLWGITPIS